MSLRHRRPTGLVLAAAIVVVAAAALAPGMPATAARRVAPRAASAVARDSIPTTNLIHVAELAPLLALPGRQRPLLVQVGFPSLYRTAHIAGSVYAGPASKPEGVRALRRALADVPHDRQVVLYCGCCPWKDCPNVRPALRAALGMGFKGVRVLYLQENLRRSGLDQGLPEAKGT